jgi:hypothetical protein
MGIQRVKACTALLQAIVLTPPMILCIDGVKGQGSDEDD